MKKLTDQIQRPGSQQRLISMSFNNVVEMEEILDC